MLEPTYAAIKGWLVASVWPAGHRLEANRIAEELGVSITPVRDSLGRLVGERLAELTPGNGFRVPLRSEQDLKDLLAFNLELLRLALGCHGANASSNASSPAPGNAGDLNTHGAVPPISPTTLLAGSVIAASLITGLNSDLPGMVTAQVTQAVYDSVTGQHLLVPQGSRLIGKYDSVVAFGQKRALVIWQRLILPDGTSVRLDNMPATDAAGYAGLADKVNFHTWSLLKGVGLATMLGVGSELSIGGDSDLVEAIRESTQTNVSRAGDQITQRNLDVQPTITIRPGAPVRVLVTRDLSIAP